MPDGAPSSITIRAFAKVNLILRIGAPVPSGDRAGYHPICSWFHGVGLHDVLVAAHAPQSAHTIMWDDGRPVDWDPGTDLVVRAHRALEAHVGRELPTSIVCLKSIPSGAGLGGGSSDAAAALVAISTLHALDLDEPALARLGASLGSDIPYFLDLDAMRDGRPPRPALVSGFGERIERLDPLDSDITLVAPPFGCATGPVYRAFDDLDPAPLDEPSVRAAAMSPQTDPSVWTNDLEPAACVIEPRLRELLDSIRGTHPHAIMTGSGSTIVVPGAAPGIESRAPGCAIHRTRLC